MSRNKRPAFLNPCLDSSDEDDLLGGKDKKIPVQKGRTIEDAIRNPNDVISDFFLFPETFIFQKF